METTLKPELTPELETSGVPNPAPESGTSPLRYCSVKGESELISPKADVASNRAEVLEHFNYTTWESKVESLEIGGQFECSFEQMGLIRLMISRVITFKYSDRIFDVQKSEILGEEILVVKRLEDRYDR
ncbi:hypothetical protein AQ505_20470 [Pedobacter sp. PACM 27299]|uniref:hypothetical protein n=1 Tax=Pedobacter sp. PACM 27299 TaxID=1727164 RepID=UPI0007069AB0|nr:hypothetical protein [Pedobacter sp. PACM 27299]ALL07654.1 hypothetical protein AQ505_20470 [Pedobacter sp. PACM 27299]